MITAQDVDNSKGEKYQYNRVKMYTELLAW